MIKQQTESVPPLAQTSWRRMERRTGGAWREGDLTGVGGDGDFDEESGKG